MLPIRSGKTAASEATSRSAHANYSVRISFIGHPISRHSHTDLAWSHALPTRPIVHERDPSRRPVIWTSKTRFAIG